MIVKMKKLTLLCTFAEQENTLEKLRELGVLHVEHVQAPEGSDLEQARNHHLYVQRALDVLKSHPDSEPTGKDADKLVDHVWQLIHREKELREELQALIHEKERMEPFGDFDPRQIKKLAKYGIHAQLYAIPAKMDTDIPGFVSICEISRDKHTVYAAAFSRHEIHLSAPKVRMPERSLSRINYHIEKTTASIDANKREFEKYAGDRDIVSSIAQEAEDQVNYLEVLTGMGEQEPACYLRGFFPTDEEDTIKITAKECGWGYVINEIDPDENPPTLIKSPKWVETIKPILDMVNLVPGYHEVDISPLFLIFFCLFYGMLVGDAGYGALFLGATIWARFKYKSAPKVIFNLLTVTSLATIIWGALTGVWFGIINLPAPLKALHVTWLSDYYNMMAFCFVVGAVHLTIAHAWKAWNLRKTPQAIAQLGWIGSTWSMLFIALNMVCGVDLPGFLLPMFGVSALLIALFMTPLREIKKKWIDHANVVPGSDRQLC